MERSCTSSQICLDSLSRDSNAWLATDRLNCYGYSLSGGIYCEFLGNLADQYGMTATEACCACGGGTCVTAPPENPVTRQSLMDFYLSTSGEKWDTKTNWASNQSYCEWYGITCERGTRDVTQM